MIIYSTYISVENSEVVFQKKKFLVLSVYCEVGFKTLGVSSPQVRTLTNTLNTFSSLELQITIDQNMFERISVVCLYKTIKYYVDRTFTAFRMSYATV